MYEEQEKNRNNINGVTLTIGAIIVAVIIIIIGLVIYYINKANEPKELTISNLVTLVRDMPSRKRQTLQRVLYATVRSNLSYNTDAPTTGAKIRDGKLKAREEIKEDNAQYVRFIVDIESIKQSYAVQVEWQPSAKTDEDETLSGYPVLVSCLSGDDVIYQDFDCYDYQSTSDDLGGFSSGASNLTSISNMLAVKQYGISDPNYILLYNNLIDYLSIMDPGQKEYSVDTNSLMTDGITVDLDFYSSKKKKYHLSLENKDGGIIYKLSDEKNDLIGYDSTLFDKVYNPPKSIIKRYLPYYGETSSGIKYTFMVNLKGKFELSINSCGKQEIKDDAIDTLKQWLESKDYNIEDFDITIPNYCDGSA